MGAARAREDLAPGTGRRRESAHCTPCTAPHEWGGRGPLAKSPTRPRPTASATCTPDGRGAAARPVAATHAHEDPAPGNGESPVRGPAPPACMLLTVRRGLTAPPAPQRPGQERDAHAGRVHGVGAVGRSRPCTRGAHVKGRSAP